MLYSNAFHKPITKLNIILMAYLHTLVQTRVGPTFEILSSIIYPLLEWTAGAFNLA